MYTEATQQAMAVLRDPGNIGWGLIPLLMLVVYAYFRELDQGNIKRVLAAFGFFGADLFNELVNSMVVHWSQYAPVWGLAGYSQYQLLIGWNIEIVATFFLTGLVATMVLPESPGLRIFGVPNRWLFIGCNAALCVLVEVVLNRLGLLVWEWPWWNATHPWLIFLLGYVPFFAICYWIYDQPSIKRALVILVILYFVDLVLLACLWGKGWL